MKAKLTSIDGPKIRLVLDKLPVVIGRNPDADARLDDRWVSRVHCEISEIDGTLVVRDLDSRNGTLVNGQSIKEAHLMPGDRLTVGLTSFKVQYKRNPTKSSACVAAAEIALGGLVKAGYGEWVTIPPGRRGGQPSRCFRSSEASTCLRNLENHEENGGSVDVDALDTEEINRRMAEAAEGEAEGE